MILADKIQAHSSRIGKHWPLIGVDPMGQKGLYVVGERVEGSLLVALFTDTHGGGVPRVVVRCVRGGVACWRGVVLGIPGRVHHVGLVVASCGRVRRVGALWDRR